MASPATTWSVYRKFVPLTTVVAVIVGAVTWAIMRSYLAGIVGFGLMWVAAVAFAMQWAPAEVARQLRRGEIDADDLYVRRSATSTTEPLVEFLRRRRLRRSSKP